MEDVTLLIIIGSACVATLVTFSILILYYFEYKKSTGGRPLTFKYLLALGIFMASLPIILSILFVFLVLSRIVSLALRMRHGSKYGGLLDGTDAIHTVEGKSKNVGNILFLVRYNPDQDDKKEFYDNLTAAILKTFARSAIKTPKLWYALKSFLGYSYYVKNDIKPEDCIGKLEVLASEEIDRNDCVELVSKYSNTPLPKDHTALWQVLIGTQAVKWKSHHHNANPNDKHYPVVLRIHHCLSDAASFVKVFVRIFGDAPKTVIELKPPSHLAPDFMRQSSTRSTVAKVNEKITIKLPTTKAVKISSKPLGYVWNVVRLTLQGLYVLVMIPPVLLLQNIVKANDKNILHGGRMSGEKIFAHGAEKLPHYMHGIKHVKNRIADTSLPDILFTAISASFRDYFEKHSETVPDSIAGLVPLFPSPAHLPHFIPEKPGIKKIVCRNVFSLGVLDLPLQIAGGKSSEKGQSSAALDRLAAVKEQLDVFKHAIDFKVNYLILMMFVGILPLGLRKPFSKMLHCTFIISIVPAPTAMTVLGGYQVDDVMFWVPNIGAMGVGFSVLSYDRRLQIGLIADKALIPKQRDAQDIVDGIYKYLDLLNLETDFSRV